MAMTYTSDFAENEADTRSEVRKIAEYLDSKYQLPFGCPPSIILRMGINVLIDNLLDAIPFIGNVFDFMWKSNLKNVELMDRYLDQPRATTVGSRAVVAFTVLFVAAVFIGCLVLSFYFATWIIGLLKAW